MAAKRSGIMLCYPFETKRLKTWKPPFIVQPKLDGERCRLVKANGQVKLISSELNEFVSVPHINQAAQELLPDNCELDGELYIHGLDFSDIHSIVGRTVNLHPDYETMQLHIFDIVNDKPQCARIIQISELGIYDPSGPFCLVPSRLAETTQAVYDFYNQYLDEKYEGIVVRHFDNFYIRRRSIHVMKFKPKKKDWYNVVSFEEAMTGDGRPKGMLGKVICVGSDGTIFPIGAGTLTHDRRYELWENRDKFLSTPKRVLVQYQNRTNNYALRFGLCLDFEDAPKQENFNPLIGGF